MSDPPESTALGNFQAQIAQGITIDQQRPDFNPLLRIDAADIPNAAQRLISPGGGLYEACGDTRGFLTPDSNLSIEASFTDQYAPAGYQAQVTNSSGALLGLFNMAADGSRTDIQFDTSNVYGWLQQFTATDAAGKPQVFVQVNDDGNVGALQVHGQDVDVGSLGATLGSQLGNVIASHLGNGLFAHMAAGTLTAAIGNELGKALQSHSDATNATAFAPTCRSPTTTAYEDNAPTINVRCNRKARSQRVYNFH